MYYCSNNTQMYVNYMEQEYQPNKEYVIQLLTRRFKLLLKWKKSNYQSLKIERMLGRNKVLLISYASKDENLLNLIFGSTNQQNVKYKQHIKNVETALKGKYSGNNFIKNIRIVLLKMEAIIL